MAVVQQVVEDRWTRRAACRGRSTSVWFPALDDQPGLARAVEVCSSCPVRARCAARALELLAAVPHTTGVWGGVAVKGRGSAGELRRVAGSWS